MSSSTIHDVDASIPALVRSLKSDSSKLVAGELKLARLEARDAVRSGTRGTVWLTVAFGAVVVALAALTVLLTVVAAGITGRMWAGALVAGGLELMVGALFLRHASAKFREPDSYTLGQTRAEVARTTSWAREELGR